MREYTLVPSDKMGKTDVITVSEDPNRVQQLNIAHTKYRKNLVGLNDMLAPEIQLKLLTLFKKHLENETKKEHKPEMESHEHSKEPEKISRTGEDNTKIVNTYLSSLPKRSSKLGNTLGNYLVSLKNIQISENGMLTKEGLDVKVHILDLVKSLITQNYNVSEAIRLFIDDLNLPHTFVRNKNVTHFGGSLKNVTNRGKYTNVKWDSF